MTPAPFQCPACGSYDVEWLTDEEIRCLDCGNVFRYPPGALRFLRRAEDLDEQEKSSDGKPLTWGGVREALKGK